jgi:hypothetical protein
VKVQCPTGSSLKYYLPDIERVAAERLAEEVK